MNILRAEAFLEQYGNRRAKLSEFYDDDEMLAAAVQTLFPGFEYPNFSHLTLGEILARYKKNPRPLVVACSSRLNELVREAITVARVKGIESVAVLRKELEESNPGEERLIAEALQQISLAA